MLFFAKLSKSATVVAVNAVEVGSHKYNCFRHFQYLALFFAELSKSAIVVAVNTVEVGSYITTVLITRLTSPHL